jgi:hypothetical protein
VSSGWLVYPLFDPKDTVLWLPFCRVPNLTYKIDHGCWLCATFLHHVVLDFLQRVLLLPCVGPTLGMLLVCVIKLV